MEHLPQQYRAGRVWNWKIGIEEPAIIPQGLDPAKVKYVISHAHQNEVGGAKLMQERYGAHIVMGAGDWDLVDQSVNGFPTGKPKRDINRHRRQ